MRIPFEVALGDTGPVGGLRERADAGSDEGSGDEDHEERTAEDSPERAPPGAPLPRCLVLELGLVGTLRPAQHRVVDDLHEPVLLGGLQRRRRPGRAFRIVELPP